MMFKIKGDIFHRLGNKNDRLPNCMGNPDLIHYVRITPSCICEDDCGRIYGLPDIFYNWLCAKNFVSSLDGEICFLDCGQNMVFIDGVERLAEGTKVEAMIPANLKPEFSKIWLDAKFLNIDTS